MVIPVRKFLLWTCISLAAEGCNQRGTEDAYRRTSMSTPATCYRFTRDRDTIELSVLSRDGRIKGKLAFRFYEKDQSSGNIDGALKGDTLLANYNFTPEGLMSSRGVAFLKKPDAFVMGSGEILNSDHAEIFRNSLAIEFDGHIILRRVDCNQVFQNE